MVRCCFSDWGYIRLEVFSEMFIFAYTEIREDIFLQPALLRMRETTCLLLADGNKTDSRVLRFYFAGSVRFSFLIFLKKGIKCRMFWTV